MTRSIGLPGGGRSDRAEDSGANDRANSEHDQIASTELAQKPASGLGCNRLTLEE